MLFRQEVWNQRVFVTKEASDKPVKSARGFFYAVALAAAKAIKTKMKHCACPVHGEHYCAMDAGRHFAYWYTKGADMDAVQKYNNGEEIPLYIEVRF